MGDLQKSNGGKIGAVAIIAIGAITVMGKTAIDAMSK